MNVEASGTAGLGATTISNRLLKAATSRDAFSGRWALLSDAGRFHLHEGAAERYWEDISTLRKLLKVGTNMTPLHTHAAYLRGRLWIVGLFLADELRPVSYGIAETEGDDGKGDCERFFIPPLGARLVQRPSFFSRSLPILLREVSEIKFDASSDTGVYHMYSPVIPLSSKLIG